MAIGLFIAIFSYMTYDMNLYKRKYPNTTPMDYFLDGKNK